MFDENLECVNHEIINEKLDTKIHLANPYAFWGGRVNENINGLIKQHSLRGTDFNKIFNRKINFFVNGINNCPRKTRNIKPPN
ncbi:Transposase [Photorhabdus asymbiotica]|uniref:Transposase n=2 Tax=Morganellaceae TaxID=1903414 RepID=B6VNM6_PHOAA|nr:Transposase [Photorhabdus asymbiotica]CAR67756.1 Transposase [Photorhabdus asymbiotica subsp. asymbiotica ATCC 43949]